MKAMMIVMNINHPYDEDSQTPPLDSCETESVFLLSQIQIAFVATNSKNYILNNLRFFMHNFQF